MKFGTGQPVTRREDVRFLTGAGQYVDDIRLPGLAIGHVFRAEVAHARIRHLDVSAARALPGVLLVLTAAETGDLTPIGTKLALKQSDGRDFARIRMPRLTGDHIRFVGQPIAFIVAETRDIARDAAECIVLETEDLPSVTSLAAALAPAAPQLHPEAPGNIAYDWTMGDAAATEAAFDRAAHVAKARVVNQRVVVASLEPRGILARYHTDAARWEVWVGNQGVHTARDGLAAALGVEKDQVRVHAPDIGGGFGMKLMDHPEYPLVALAARLLDRPVKWVGDRSESFLSDAQGRDLTSDAEGAFDAAGRLLALRVDSLSGLGAYYSSMAPGIHTILSAPLIGGMYDCPAIFQRVRGVLTNTTPMDAYRGAGRPEIIHVTEQVMEQAARDMGIDPLELRARNLVRPDQLPYRTQGGFTFDSLDPLSNLGDVAARIDRAGFPARRAASEAAGRLRGLGIAYYFERTGGSPAEQARLRLLPGGTMEAIVGTQATGQGHETAYGQLVAERLGLPLEGFHLLAGDSDSLPAGGGTGGSRSLIMAGRVLTLAADAVIAEARQRAAARLEVAPTDIDFAAAEGGLFRVTGTDLSVSLLDLVAEAEIEGTGSMTDGQTTFPNGAHAVEVEIDPETGAVFYLRHVVTDDFGVIVNPLLAAGQVHGGIVQGAGQVLGEAMLWDDTSGQPLTGSFMDYAMPRAADVPMFETAFNEVPCRTNALGVKGCGEAGSVGALPALALAIQNALHTAGVTQLTPPFTPHKLWTALHSVSQT